MGFLQVMLLCCIMIFCICQKKIDAGTWCQPGMKMERNSKKCVPCPDYQYQKKPNNRNFCSNCMTCDEEAGSELISKCTRTENAKCRCREGFIPKRDHSSCKCDRGFEFNEKDKTCQRCKLGFFNPEAGQKCRAWTECGNQALNTNGSHLSDVVCGHNTGNSQTPNAQDPASASVRVEKRVTIAAVMPTATPLTTTPPPPSVPSSTPHTTTSPSVSKRPPVENSGFPGYAIVVPPVLLLILLCPIFCKHLIIPFIQNYKKKAATPCRRPVEESGESSRSSLVKSALGQP